MSQIRNEARRPALSSSMCRTSISPAKFRSNTSNPRIRRQYRPPDAARQRACRWRATHRISAGSAFAEGSWLGVERSDQLTATRPLPPQALAQAFTGTLRVWFAQHGIDTITVAGYMTQNCDSSTIYEAAYSGLEVEFLSDASGTLAYENSAGSVSAEEVHRVLSVVFQSPLAAVSDTRIGSTAGLRGIAERDNPLRSGGVPASANALRPERTEFRDRPSARPAHRARPDPEPRTPPSHRRYGSTG